MNWWLCCYWHEPDAPQDPVGLVRIWALAGALTRLGDLVTVFAPRYRSALVRRSFRTVPVPLLSWPIVRPLSHACMAFLMGLWAGLRKKPEVIYYRWMESAHPFLLARIFGSACICEINGEPVPPWQTGGVRSRMTHLLARVILRRCDRVVVLTEGLGNLVVARYGVDRQKLVLLPSGSDIMQFRGRDRYECRRELGLDQSAQYVGFVGSFYRYQGLTTMLEAFVLMRRASPSLCLLMVGDGEEAKTLQAHADRLGLSSCITWTGRVEYAQVPRWIGAMDVCVAPFCGGRGETSPVKIFDYLACERPVVASAIPSVADLITPGHGVVLVEPDRVEALADAVSHLLDHSARSEDFARAGRRLVEQQFSWDAITGELRDLVRKIVPGKSAATRMTAPTLGGHT